jgi:GNAT superfamily N-acetyltransferase
MNQIIVTTVDGLEPGDAVAIVRRLTRSGSEFQIEVQQVLDGDMSSCTPLAVWNHDGAVIGWACSHVWRGHQTLEQYTDERHRGRGIASALSATLLASRVIDTAKDLAVFSPVTAEIARRIGVAEVVLYQRNGSEWVLV